MPLALAFLAAMWAGPLDATSMLKEDLARLALEADRIFVGRVVSVQSAWDQAERRVFTQVGFEVTEGIKGTRAGQRVDLKVIGGMSEVPGRGPLTLTVPGVPQFTEGERVLLFAQDDPRLLCPIAGWFQGTFRVVRDPRTGRDVLADSEGRYLTGFDGNDVQVGADDGRVEVSDLASRVRSLLASAGGAGSAGDATQHAAPGMRPLAPAEIVHVEPSHETHPMTLGARPRARPRRTADIGLGLALVALGAATIAWSVFRHRKAGAR